MRKQEFLTKLCETICDITGSDFPCICGENKFADNINFSESDIKKAEKIIEILNIFSDDIKMAGEQDE